MRHHRGEEEEEEDQVRIQRHRNTEGGRRPRGSHGNTNRELTALNEADQTSVALQECLRLLEETFPFTEEQQLGDVDGRRGEFDCQLPDTEPLLPPVIPTEEPSLDLELQWQDLLAIMEPENTNVDMMAPFEHTLDSRPSGIFQDVGSEALSQQSNNFDSVETPLHHGLPRPRSQSDLEPALVPLIPSAELDDQSSTLNMRDTLPNPTLNLLHNPMRRTNRLAEDLSENLSMGLNTEDNSSAFNINLLSQDDVDNMELENFPGFDVNFHSSDELPSSFTPTLEGHGMPQDFLVDEEDVEDEDGLPLSDLLEDATILEEMTLLDLALEEGFSPEMAARLEEEGYLTSGVAQQETGRDNDHSGSNMVVTQDQPGRNQQDGEGEADSDSGLSLDFSHSPASPCVSEASSYSSYSASSSSSSSASSSSIEGPLSEDEDEDAEEGLTGSDMEVEVTIKQEELEEEVLGAVGGGYPGDGNKLFPSNFEDHKLFHGFPWQEHICHDHTYNQPWSTASSPSLGEIPTKHTKSLRHENAKPYHRSSSRQLSESKMWSRDERRARALKIPFSNELIVNLPVEEFNDLLSNYQLNGEQLTLIRDIRRRGKNKIAAQNCRKRKLGVLLGLEDNVSGLRRHRSRLLREKQEALKNLQEMKRRLGMLYDEVFSRLRDEEGRPLDATEYLLDFGPNGSITVASRQQGGVLPLTREKSSKKQRDKKK